MSTVDRFGRLFDTVVGTRRATRSPPAVSAAPAARRWSLIAACIGLLCGAAGLAFVAVSPDLRLRIVLASETAAPADGVTVVDTDGLAIWGGPDAERPRPGDVLRQIGDRDVRDPVDFYDACNPLFRLTPGEFVPTNSDDPQVRFGMQNDSPFVRTLDGRRFVRVRFRRPTDPPDVLPRFAFVEVLGVPVRRLWLLLAWLIPQVGLTLVGAAAVWLRPFDRAARLFLLMGVCTTVAVAGASHWWALAHAAPLLVPVVVAGALLPALTLHFFLAYPRALPPLGRFPRLVRAGLYAPAAAAAAAGLAGVGLAAWESAGDAAAAEWRRAAGLWLIEAFVNALLGLSAAAFLLVAACLWGHWRRARLRVERGQVRLLLLAAAAAAPAVGYLLYLAFADRVGFVHRRGRLPVLGVSLLFALAYTAGMAKYRLLRVDEVLRGGTRLLLARAAVALAAGVAVAAAARADRWLEVPLAPTGSALVAGAAAVLLAAAAVAAAGAARQRLDRTFYREKYRLDRVLKSFGTGHAAARAAARSLADGCRDVLGCDRAAVYLADGDGGTLTRAAAAGGGFPDRLAAADLPAPPGTGGGRAAGGSPGPVAVPAGPLREATGCAAACPLPAGDDPAADPVGWVLLGPKEDRTALSAEDLTFLEALGRTAGAALREGRAREELDRLRGSLRARDDDRDRLARRVRALEAELSATLGGESPTPAAGDIDRCGLRGHGPAVAAVLDEARRVAASDASVLIRGESGTGKELLARVLHANGPRAGGPLVAVHCAALSPALLESELFGHVRGAFTGADRDRAGRFEQADGGTLFLDEIGDVPAATQVKLLRALQERTFERVGGDRPVTVDVRVVAATHRDLEALIAAGEFREDLFYRLNVVTLDLPPLRDRPEDLPELAYGFLYEAARRNGRAVARIDEDALAALLRHRWPGNVRELRNVMERAAVLAETDTVTPADLPAALRLPGETPAPAAPPRRPPAPAVPPVPDPAPPPPEPPRSVPAPGPATDVFGNRPAAFVPGGGWGDAAGDAGDGNPAWAEEEEDEVGAAARAAADAAERARFAAVLKACRGNKSKAARRLNLPRSTFYSRLQKHGLAPPHPSHVAAGRGDNDEPAESARGTDAGPRQPR